MYYRGAAAAIVVYDITQASGRGTKRGGGVSEGQRRSNDMNVDNRRRPRSLHRLTFPALPFHFLSTHAPRMLQAGSFVTLKNWVKELQTLGPEGIIIAVCGNKADMAERRVSACGAAACAGAGGAVAC